MATAHRHSSNLVGFTQRVLIVIGLVGAALLVWQWFPVLLLVFGAVLVAVLLRSVARPIEAHTPVRGHWAVAVAGLAILAVLLLVGWLFGSQISAQASNLTEQLPAAWRQAQAQLTRLPFGEDLVEQVQRATGGPAQPGSAEQTGEQEPPRSVGLSDLFGDMLGRVTAALRSVLTAITNLVVILFAGIFLALKPQTYRDGVVLMFPPDARDRVGEALDAAGRALRKWLLGTLLAMLLVGVLTGLGAWALGLPAPLALGLIAGLLEFVPYVGPVTAAIPAILLALLQGPDMVLYTVLLYAGVQQLEGNLIYPAIQRRAVDLPPALTIFSVIAFGILFGPLGIVLATPLAVVAFVMIKKLWIKETLGDDGVEVPGEPSSADHS